MKPPLVVPASHDSQPPPTRRRLRVRGIVQGVGFRPYVYTLAMQLGLGGFVGNDSSGVSIEIEGPVAALDQFEAELQGDGQARPPLAVIESVEAQELAPKGELVFTIVASDASPSAAVRTFVSPDQALCADCRRELFDPADRRYRYPFINCTNCGPRFTIIRGIPYDRPLTTMAGFPMCEDCRREYEDPANRRFHAQPIACPVCGPQLTFVWTVDAGAAAEAGAAGNQAGAEAGTPAERSYARTCAALADAQLVLASGRILAVKGLGGYHLACDAAEPDAVALLRQRKGRSGKPFAVMAASLEAAKRIAFVDAEEARVLASGAHPIVLLRKRPDAALADNVAPGNGYVGVMLPYTPLHDLLFSDLGAGAPRDVLVMTSGNLSEEPIAWRDEDALARLTTIADAFLLHDRPIHVPCDDSVVRIHEGHELPVRRARGYAPLPVTVFQTPTTSQALLATGADLKSTLCLLQGEHAVLSQHIGDMGNVETYDAFTRAAEHMQTLFRVEPEVLACDAHPGYLSTRWAHEHAQGRPVIAVQHHHAHIVSLLAERGAAFGAGDEPVIGFSFDGTGYGTDGAIWGGEVLLAGCATFERCAHLRYVPLPGGDAAVQRPYRAALAHLWAAGVDWLPALPPVAACTPDERALLRRQLETGFNCAATSSMGRLCDAVAALAGVCQAATYEAQAAIELEALVGGRLVVDPAELASLGYEFHYTESAGTTGGATIVDAAPLVRQVAADVLAGRTAGWIAAHFHAAVAHMIVRCARAVRDRTGVGRVALSGGVFQNVVLLSAAAGELQRAGFAVLVHRRVPPNDGGLALGQAVIAARKLRL